MEKTNYQELSRRVGNKVLCNNITNADENLLDNLENGELYYQEKDSNGELIDDYAKEIFQYYIITDSGANYLKSVSDEIVFYSPLLGVYVWGITHFGTPWDGVDVTLKDHTKNIRCEHGMPYNGKICAICNNK